MGELRQIASRVTDGERGACWSEARAHTLCGVIPDRGRPGVAWTDIRSRLVAGLEVFAVRAAAHQVRRGKWEISRRPTNSYLIWKARSGHSWWGFESHDREVRPGDLMFADADRHFSYTATAGDFDFDLWLIPKELVESMIPDIGRMTGAVLDGRSGAASLIADYLDILKDREEGLDRASREEVGRHLTSLLALALPDSKPATHELTAVAEGSRLERALHLIERRLNHADLNPETAAREIGMSVRTLHLLLAPTGESFAQRVRRRRLEQAHKLLADPGQIFRSITDIALSCGFDSLSTFYRLFREAYGHAPGTVRSSHLETCG